MNPRIEVIVICDPTNSTWDIMNIHHQCLHYGTAESCDEWLEENKETHVEVK